MAKVCPTCNSEYDGEIKFCPEDGTVLAAPSQAHADPYIGRTIANRWRIQEKLGEGGMGAVYRAHQADRNRMVAIKILHEEMRHDDLLVKRFRREAKAVARLRHPHIVELYVSGVLEEGTPFMVMEYVRGKSLFEVLNQARRLDERIATHIMTQVCAALQEAHRQGIIHRDLKPENILVCSKDQDPWFVKVLDFGIAKIADDEMSGSTQLTRAGTVFGTPEYLSPEQAAAEPLDARSDIYALGVILYEMVVGQVPFTSSTAMRVLLMHLNDTPRRPLEVVPDCCSPEVEAVILKAMSKKREERFQTVAEMTDQLHEVRAQLAARAGTDILPEVEPGRETLIDPGGAVPRPAAAPSSNDPERSAPAPVPSPPPPAHFSAPDPPQPVPVHQASPQEQAPPPVVAQASGGGMSTTAWVVILVLLSILALAGGAAVAYFLM